MKDAVDREDLDCEFEMRRSYDVYIDEGDAKEAEKLYRTAIREGHQWARDFDFVGEEFAEQVRLIYIPWLTGGRCTDRKQVTSIQGAKAAISMPVCSLWPYKFVTQLLSKLVDSRAVTLFTHTPVLSISSSDTSLTVLHTAQGNMITKKLIFATNAYTPAVCPVYKNKIVPYKGSACHIAPLHPISPHLSNTYNIYFPHPSDEVTRVDYLNPRPDSGIVVGGGKDGYVRNKPLWYNNTDDSTLIPHVRDYFTAYMQRVFRGWESSKATITHLWTGIQGETKDGFPFVGKVPEKESWYIAAGFNGGGMTFIFSCAEGLAKIVEGKTYKEAGLPKMLDAARMEV